MLLTFESVDKIIKCAHSSKHYFLCCTMLYLLMSASSLKMLSKNRPEVKKKENHILTYISRLPEVKRRNNYGVAISLKASSKRKNTVRVLDSFGRITAVEQTSRIMDRVGFLFG